jgi:5'-nucleotidase
MGKTPNDFHRLSVFREGTDQLGGEIDLDALVRYFMEHSPVAPGPQNRITRTG